MTKKLKQMPKWLNGIVNLAFYLCLLAAILVVLQVFVVTSFRIPTDSMEPAMLPGDYILVDKCSAGARLFDVLSALDRKEVTIRRMPGWRDFKREDVLVFNFPYQPHRWDSIAFDVMKYYVKRCVAIPGDTLEIRNGFYKIRGLNEPVGCLEAQKGIAQLPDSGVPGIVMGTYPWNEELGWTIKEFGPLAVPAKGQVVKMDFRAWLLYRSLIGWEQNGHLRVDAGGRVLLGDSVISEYRFCENYYFMVGDKAGNSQDSRYWGLLPETFIVGRAWRIWKSEDPEDGNMRWKRILKRIE